MRETLPTKYNSEYISEAHNAVVTFRKTVELNLCVHTCWGVTRKKLKSSSRFKQQMIFVVSKTTSNITRHFKSGTAPLYHSLVTSRGGASIGPFVPAMHSYEYLISSNLLSNVYII